VVGVGLWHPRPKGGVRRAHFHCVAVLPLLLLFLPAFIVFVSLSAFPSQLSLSCFFPVCSPRVADCCRSLPWGAGGARGCTSGRRRGAGDAGGASPAGLSCAAGRHPRSPPRRKVLRSHSFSSAFDA